MNEKFFMDNMYGLEDPYIAFEDTEDELKFQYKFIRPYMIEYQKDRMRESSVLVASKLLEPADDYVFIKYLNDILEISDKLFSYKEIVIIRKRYTRTDLRNEDSKLIFTNYASKKLLEFVNSLIYYPD